jgi:cytochrome c-type biogenesis protein CcmF
MDYIGEHLLPGYLGQFFISLSLVASLVATYAYFKSVKPASDQDGYYWKKLARIAFITETISVLAIFSILFYIIQNHLFEYKYAWQHSSRSLELKYLLACFWEGQEGSFLLWSIWHCLLGLVLIKTGRSWEGPVMTVLSFAQFCLATMIAGIYLFGEKIGSNPFILLRDSGVLDNAPALHLNFDINQPLKPDYMASIKDGNDLNPLLQNYWMVIHPPVLFLGFASTIIPFAFAVAGLWTKRLTEWTKAVLPWALFSAAVFGVGIMMGAKWAYESLTFGGYWAWDPVENASLVPWLILIAGIHTLLIFNHTGHSLRATYLFFILSFGFVLYSTFLTRSGVLGEASVHAFTDLGMNVQLYLLLFAFIWPVAIIGARTFAQKKQAALVAALFIIASFLVSKYGVEIGNRPIAPILGMLTLLAGIGFIVYQIQTQVPTIQKEESASSREFWMFIGSLVFFLSAMVIIVITSVPVINKIFSIERAAGESQEFLYNQIHIFVAIIITVLTAATQYLKYKSTQPKFFWKKIWIPTVIAILLACLVIGFGDINYDKEGPGFLAAIWLAVACSIYTVIANGAYIWIGLKGKFGLSGGSVSHLGFGLALLGVLLSSSKKEILSYNIGGIPIDFGTESKEKTGENLTLVKGLPMKMGKFDVTYVGDSAHPKKEQWYYQIHFKSRTDNEEFTLWPNAFVNYKGNEGLMANPDSRHYLDHDIFTYISALPNPEKNKDTANFRTIPMKEGDSLFYSKGYIILEKLVTRDNIPVAGFEPGDKATVASLKVYSFNKTSYTSEPFLVQKQSTFFAQPDTVMSESIILQVNKVENGVAEIGLKESNAILQYVTLKAYKFPYIKVLWLGIVITAIGIFMSMFRRIMLNRRSKDPV